MDATEINEVKKLWKDGTIRRLGKSELINLFNERFGYKGNDTLLNILNGKKEPTPLQLQFLIENVQAYWKQYNATRNKI